MSHELRTPLNAIIGFSEVLSERMFGEVNDKQAEYLSDILESGQHLLSLINDILDLSKIEAGKLTFERVEFDPSRVLDDVAQTLDGRARAQGLTLTLRTTPDMPRLLWGDPNRLRQVLINLTANAVKFTERGRVTVDASVVTRIGRVTTVRFAVTDTGIGLRSDQIATLFSAFVQADASTTRRYGGTGLGLALCKQIVETMGGQIGVESQEGQGSTFWCIIAFDAAAEITQPSAIESGGPRPVPAAPPADRQRDPSDEPATPSHHDERVLIAEDNVINRFVALSQLAKLGYKADAVTNGAEAVEALRNGQYDLVLMDCEMPTMDGYEATRRIRGAGQGRVPIIAVTASAMSGDREKCIAAGMDAVLSKPVDLQRLKDLLASWLPGRS
jgi:CheY-like chemotaxis protein